MESSSLTLKQDFPANWETELAEEFHQMLFYDTEEVSPTRFNLVLCQRFHRLVHGSASGLREEVTGGFVTVFRMKAFVDPHMLPSFLDLDSEDEDGQALQHQTGYMRMEIAEVVRVQEYSLCILKTWWLRLVQRVWRNRFARGLPLRGMLAV